MNRALKLVGLHFLFILVYVLHCGMAYLTYYDFSLEYKLQALFYLFLFEVIFLPSFTFVWLLRFVNGDRAGLSDY